MKKFIVAVLLMSAGFLASAQIPGGEMSRKGAKLFADGKPLSAYMVMESVGIDVYRGTYLSATKQIGVGRALAIVGGVVGLCGVSYMGIASRYYHPVRHGLWMKSAIGAEVVAGAFISAGIPLICIGSKRLGWIADEYNAGHYDGGVTVEFGAQQNGVGLVLRF